MDELKQIDDLQQILEYEELFHLIGKGALRNIAIGMYKRGVRVIPEGGVGNFSDDYHTFNELYHHRAVLFSVICNLFPDKAWKSRLHATGDMYEGMFIVGIETPEGQATYHYDLKPYWDMFRVKELDMAPPWDGHSSEEAIGRIGRMAKGGVALSRRELDALQNYSQKITSERDVLPMFGEGDLVRYKNSQTNESYMVKGVYRSHSGMYICILSGGDDCLYYEPEHLLERAYKKVDVDIAVSPERVELEVRLDGELISGGSGNIYRPGIPGILSAMCFAMHAAYKKYGEEVDKSESSECL